MEREAAKRCDVRGVRAAAYRTAGARRESRGRRPEGKAAGRSDLGIGLRRSRGGAAAQGVGVRSPLLLVLSPYLVCPPVFSHIFCPLSIPC